MFSRISQRMFRSEDMPWARIICTCPSISDRVIASLPTTATVLSMRPFPYFWADAASGRQSAAANATVILRIPILISIFRLNSFFFGPADRGVLQQLPFQTSHSGP